MIPYARLAADYAAHRRVHPGVLAALAAASDGAQALLEIGCGSGNYLTALQAGGATCVGLDPAAAMLAEARRQTATALVQARGEVLPFAAASFDLIYSVDVVHHLPAPVTCFREARRVLRRGGALCTVTDSPQIIAARVPLACYWPETIAVEMARYHPIARLEAWLAEAGFAHCRTETVAHPTTVTDSAPYRARAYSCLHLIDDDAFTRGLARLEADLARDGAIAGTARYTLVWAT